MTTEKDPSPPAAAPPPTPDELKQKGNDCIRQQNYLEAVLHYTHAIKLTPNDEILYSNRSVAFLKTKHLYYANEDADKVIQLKPDWAKGYFRKAAVHEAAGEYDTALLLYSRAFRLRQNDTDILNAAKRVAALSNRETMFEKRVPWVGAGIGIILGVIIVICDAFLAKSPTLKHPAVMVLMVVAISGFAFLIAKGFRYWKKLRQRGRLDPPVDLMDGFKKEEPAADAEEEEQTPNRQRYTKAQARQRFKKGKT